MAGLRPSSLRHLTSFSAPQYCRPQRRWARVLDVRFVATQQARERILDRYRDQLHQKAKQQGLEDIEQLKEVYKDKISILRKRALVPGATTALKQSPNPQSQTSWPVKPPPPPAQPLDQLSPSSPHFKPPSVKTLSSYLDVEKTRELPKREIEALWRLRHVGNSRSLCATLPTDMFSQIYASARKHPQFILPGLPAAEAPVEAVKSVSAQAGAPIHFLQWTFPAPDTATVLFTHLAEYKLRGEYAQPHTTITHHSELSKAAGLVLCQGNVFEGRGVSMEEAKWLLLSMQKFYNIGKEEVTQNTSGDVKTELSKRRRRLMEQFSSGDSAFNVAELLDIAERVG